MYAGKGFHKKKKIMLRRSEYNDIKVNERGLHAGITEFLERIKNESDKLEQINSSEQYKHEYKINTNHAIFVLKKSVVKMILSDSPREQKRLFIKIEHELFQCLSPVRKDRAFPRDKKHQALKFAFYRKWH